MPKFKLSSVFCYIKRAVLVIPLFFFSASCAMQKVSPFFVDQLVVESSYEHALKIIGNNPKVYGRNNQLLYLFDKGLIEHLYGRYAESIKTFEQAKLKYDQLYTKSVTNIAATWVINDKIAPYHGEDFEHVFINIFQALNYMMLGNYQEALVEARDVDSKLYAINTQYAEDQKNVYKEDAFARMLMGILYETSGTREGLNDAYISYSKALDTYEKDYADNYGLHAPKLLKENLQATAGFMGEGEVKRYINRLGNISGLPLKEKAKKAEVYLVQYNGLSPIKTAESLTFPMLDGNVIKIAFPKYVKRPYGIIASRLSANDGKGNNFCAATELGQDIGAIAIKNLASRKARLIAKSIARATGRYIVEKKQAENIRKKHSAGWADLFKVFSGLYNVMIEQADLRSWQTLPDQIRIAKLPLGPGEYEFAVENFSADGSDMGTFKLGTVKVSAGEKIFFILRTAR